MKKKAIVLALLLFIVGFGTFAQESPMKDWIYPDIIFSPYRSLSYSYNEQDGYAIVQGQTRHYWLYNTVANHNGDASEIYNKIIPSWAEKMGYVVDYDNIRVSNPNTALATSVRTLMSQRNSDVSLTLVTSGSRPYIVVNEYFASKNSYKTTTYPLYRR